MNEPMIETERLILRPHVISDLEASVAMFSDPVVMRFVGGSAIPREDIWNRLLRYIGHWSVFGYGLFAIIEKGTGAFVGETGLAHFGRGLGEGFDLFPEAAWALTSANHGKGYALEATRAAHQWFDANQKCLQTVCIINPENTASKHLAAKLGYTSFADTNYRSKVMTMYQRRGPVSVHR